MKINMEIKKFTKEFDAFIKVSFGLFIGWNLATLSLIFLYGENGSVELGVPMKLFFLSIIVFIVGGYAHLCHKEAKLNKTLLPYIRLIKHIRYREESTFRIFLHLDKSDLTEIKDVLKKSTNVKKKIKRDMIKYCKNKIKEKALFQKNTKKEI